LIEPRRLEKIVLFAPPVQGNLDTFLADAAAYAALGVTELQVIPDRRPVEYAERLVAQVVPRLAPVA
jgi:hypothetical protein